MAAAEADCEVVSMGRTEARRRWVLESMGLESRSVDIVLGKEGCREQKDGKEGNSIRFGAVARRVERVRDRSRERVNQTKPKRGIE